MVVPMVQHGVTSFGGDTRFHVELTKDNYCISWTKLLKGAQPAPPPPGAKPGLESRIAPEIGPTKQGDEQGQGRLNSVIEKIERLYKGGSSDDEVEAEDAVGATTSRGPDDHEYNTEDSFIDDEELDEYFAVDGIKTKHTGFFVNKGAIESLEDTGTTSGLKRKKQDVSTKSLKRMKAAARRLSSSAEAQGARASRPVQQESQAYTGHRTSSSDMENTKEEHAVDTDSSKLKKSKDRLQFDATNSKSAKPSPVAVKDGSPTKRAAPKCTNLEKAIQELEKAVAELTNCKSEVEDPGQPNAVKVKRVLPREVKCRLAKVARLAGAVSDDLVQRLMRTMAPYMQVKTLKRNLREMIELGLTAKKEKQGKMESIKGEIVDMVRASIGSNARDNSTTGGQETGQPESGSGYTWDHATEDRICDLYELYLEGMDEHKAAPSRKFYNEMAELWPEGWMDNNGVKAAVLRAKERRKDAMKQAKLEEKKRKKLSEAPLKSSQDVRPVTNRVLPSSENAKELGMQLNSNGVAATVAAANPVSLDPFVSTSLRRIKKELNKNSGKDCCASAACLHQHPHQQPQQHYQQDKVLSEPC